MLTVDELLDQAAERARSVLLGKPKASLMPTWIIQAKDKTTLVGTPWDGDEDKTIMTLAIRAMLKKEQAHSYSFMSEAWMAHESLSHPIGLSPSQREDRIEVLIVTAFDRQGGKVRFYEIKRGKKDVIIELVLQPQGDMDHFSGDLYNLFA